MKNGRRTTIGEVCSFLNGGTPSKSVERYFQGDIPWITGADITSPVVTTARSFITKEAVASSATNRVPAGTVLLVTRTSVGKVATAGVDLCFSQDITALTPDASLLHASYLVEFLKTQEAHFERQARGATIKGITRQVVGDMVIPVPPLAEQRRIAEVLDRAEALRAKRRAALAQLDSLTQSLFLDLFGDPKIPARTIGDLLESGVLLLHKDGNHGSQYPRAEDFGGEGVPFLSAKAISDDGLIDNALIENLREEKAVKLRIGWISKGDVLLAHNASVGKVALYDGRFEKALIGTSLTAFRPNPETLDSRYLAAAFRSERFQRELEKNMGQTTRNQVPITAQRELKVSLPPIPLQREFARRVTAVEALKTAQRASLAELDALFATLQHRAFKGEL